MFYQEIGSDDSLLNNTINDPHTHISKEGFIALALEYWHLYLEPEFEKLRRAGASQEYIEKLKYDEASYIDRIYSMYRYLPISCVSDTVNCMRQIGKTIQDPRNKNRVKYPLDSLIFVIMIASLRGDCDAQSIAEFYKYNLLELQLLIPGLPPMENLLTKSTINTVFSLVQKEDIELLFSTYFNMPSFSKEELITYDDDKYKNESLETKDTLGFDGQEMRSSFQKGSNSRSKKGGIIVTLHNCSKRYSQAYTCTDTKNHEVLAFIDLVHSTSIQGTVVVADALNTDAAVTDLIVDKGADYLLPIKKTRGNKELLNHVEAIFNREHRHALALPSSNIFKDHGRIEELFIEILEAEKYIDKRIKNPHSNLHTLVKYTKKVSPIVVSKVIDKKVTETTRYYISSLQYLGEETLQQVWHSIRDYWFIEEHHHLLDGPMFNQDQLQGCNPNTLSNHAGFNKITRNILTDVRQHLSSVSNKKTPVTYRSTQTYIQQKSLYHTLSLIKMYFTRQNKKCDIAPL